MNAVLPFDQAATLLPFGLRQVALAIPKTEQAVAEELRLRAGRPLSVTFPDGESVLPGAPGVSAGDLRTVLEIATQASAHTALDKVRHGFVTVRGGPSGGPVRYSGGKGGGDPQPAGAFVGEYPYRTPGQGGGRRGAAPAD